MAKTIKLSCVSYYKHNYTVPTIGWDKPVYIDYEGGLRAMRLKRMDVEVVNFPNGYEPVPSARWTMEVAGLGEVVLLNGCHSFPIQMYLTPEDYEAKRIADPCNCNYGRLWDLHEWVAECFRLTPEELGVAVRKSVHDGSAIAILRYRWTGTTTESVPVEIPTTAYYDRTGWHFSEPCSLMGNTYPSNDECKRCSSLNVVEFGDDDEPEKTMVLYEVDEEDNTKTSIVAMKETDWQKRKPEAIEKVLREYFDERYADCDDEYFCYEDEIKQAVEALTTGYDTEFNGDSLFWDSVEMI